MRTSGSAGGPQRITHFSLPCSGKKRRVLLQKKGYLRGKSLLVSFRFSTRTAVCGLRGSNSLPGIPRMAMAIRGSPASPRMISRAARRSRQRVLGAVCQKRKHHLLRWCFSGAGDEARTRYLDLGKVALYQMSYARKRKIDYNPAGGICQPLRSAFFSFFSG